MTKEQAAKRCAIWLKDRVERTLREFYTTNNVERAHTAGATNVPDIEALLLQEFKQAA